MLSQGVALGNRYRLNAPIAAGGMGEVWRCQDTLLKREVAVKVLLPALIADPEFTTRFRSEALMLAALRHPGIVQVHDFGEATLTDGSRVSYLVMAYVDGEPLLARIRRAGRLGVQETMSIVRQAAQALHAAHMAGIVHRDVKPSNLLVQQDGTVVLVDFGIARSAALGNITATNIVVGTASYMSPEQAVNQPVTAATDVYSLGAVAYICLTGRPPFVGDNPIQVAMQHLRSAPPPLPADVPAPVAALVARALAKEPADRYRSAAEFADAASTAAGQTAPRVPPPYAPQPAALAPAPSFPPPYAPPPAPSFPPPYAPSPDALTPTPRFPSPVTSEFPQPTPPNTRNHNGRRVALAGAAGTVLLALVVLVTAVALQPYADQKTRTNQGSTLTQESGTELPAGRLSPSAIPDPGVTAAAGIHSRTVGPSGPGAKPDSSASGKTTTTGSPRPTTTSPSAPTGPSTTCRTWYTSNGWNTRPCIKTESRNGVWSFVGWARVMSYPSTCAGYRVYLVDKNGSLVRSTSLRPCSELNSAEVVGSVSAYPSSVAQATLRAFNSSGSVILSVESPLLDGA